MAGPETTSRVAWPAFAAPSRTQAMRSASKRSAGECQIIASSQARPSGSSTSFNAARNSASKTSTTASSRWRRSAQKNTSPGTTLRELA